MTHAIQLFSRPRCPYCRTVRGTLEALGLEFEEITVPAMRFRRSTVKERSGQSGVPVLVDTATGLEGMAESADIVAYLEETYG